MSDIYAENHQDDQADREREMLLDNCPEFCPACGSGDLHSALLGGEEAISCCDCVWAATIASFQSDRDSNHGS